MTRKQVLIAATLIAVFAASAAGGYEYDQPRKQEERALLAQQEAKKANEPKPMPQADQDRLVAEAAALLDSWAGDPALLNQVAKKLALVQRSNPKHGNVHVELARYFLYSSLRYGKYGRRYTSEAIDQAAEQVREAASLANNKSADANVLFAHLRSLRQDYRTAMAMLDEAEKLGTNNPWLHLYRADVLFSQHRFSQAESALQLLKAKYAARAVEVPSLIGSNIHTRRAKLYVAQSKIKEADLEWQQSVALNPSAWRHGDYAHFLLHVAGSPDAAFDEAQKALGIMDYDALQALLAEIHIVKWAQLKSTKHTEADKHLAAARAFSRDLGWFMPSAASAIGAGPAIQVMVKELLKLGIPVDAPDEGGDTGLINAARDGLPKSIKILIDLGANKNAANHNGQTAMSVAALHGRPEMVAALVKGGVKINAVDANGNAGLHLAVAKRHLDTVKQFITLKADLNIRAKNDGVTPLMVAVQIWEFDIARMLVEAGADVSLRSEETKRTAADILEATMAITLDAKLAQLMVDYLHEAAARPTKRK